MYLKRLEIHGFKSFAHKTVLDFDPGMTAVVGPNGSGKSNVADSLRWVMGEQSLKLLRGKKSEDVIFAGSDKKSKLSMAEVSLTFDNKDHKMPLEYAEVVLTRRLFRNGDSEYLINNQRARLLDVVDALIRSGFGATNYAVIGQGTIDQMVMAGPTEIKNLVEEASGVKPYYIKRDKTNRRLEQTEENLSRVSELLKEIEPRLRSLKRQAKRMEEREMVAAQLNSLQMEFFGQQYYLLEGELGSLSGHLDTKTTAVTNLQNEIKNFQIRVDKEEQKSESSNSFIDALEKKLQALEDSRFGLMEKLAEIRGLLKSELPMGMDFSQFRVSFESILDTLTAENIKEVREKLKHLVSDFGQVKKTELLNAEKELNAQLEQIGSEMAQQKNAKAKLMLEEKQKKVFLTQEEKQFREKNSELSKLKDERNSILVEKARLDTKLENLTKEVRDFFGTVPDLKDYKKAQIASDTLEKISKLKHQLELAGGVDEATIKEYKETQERFDYLSSQSQDLSKAVVDLRSVIVELDQIIKKQFDEAYVRISEKFVEYFRILFNGGRAQMTLVKAVVGEEESEDVALENEEPIIAHIDGIKEKKPSPEIVGIEIKATPPGKKLASIAALSGGERALTAIALLCSMLACYPSPFVVLDEVDAALDEANSIRFAKILGTLAHQTQFITITHNRETMRQAHTLYGVTMSDEGISKILSLKLEKAEELVK
ncbi:MAG TPA: AAA family ATPase [Methylomirabilota bacterium]|nr:AAA family ATPase [Methylomirabilota bacterium]